MAESGQSDINHDLLKYSHIETEDFIKPRFCNIEYVNSAGHLHGQSELLIRFRIQPRCQAQHCLHSGL